MSDKKLGIYVRVESLKDWNLVISEAEKKGFHRPNWIGVYENLDENDFPTYVYMFNHEILRSPTRDDRYEEVKLSEYFKVFYVKSILELSRMTIFRNKIKDGHHLLEFANDLKQIMSGHTSVEEEMAIKWLLGDTSIDVRVEIPTMFALETIATNYENITFYYCETSQGIPTKTNSIKNAMLFGTKRGAERYQTPAWKIIEVNDYE